MDSGSFQNDPFNISEDKEEEFHSIRTRLRTAKRIQRKNNPTHKPADEIEQSALLGESGLGLTAEEFRSLPNSEREQLLEAVLQSKEEYKMQERKAKAEQLDVHNTVNKKTSELLDVHSTVNKKTSELLDVHNTVNKKTSDLLDVHNTVNKKTSELLDVHNTVNKKTSELLDVHNTVNKKTSELLDVHNTVNKKTSELLDVHNTVNKKTANSMPVKLECSVPLSRVVIDTMRLSVRPSLNKFRLKKLSDVTAESKATETVVNSSSLNTIEYNEDYLAEAEASVAELVGSDEHNSIGAEKCKLTADKPKLGVIELAEESEDTCLREKIYPRDCSGVRESNSLDLSTPERNVQLWTRNGKRFSTERETSSRCILLENDETSPMYARDVSISLRKAEATEENFMDCLVSPKSYRLIRKYRVQATDERPLFKQNGLDLKTRVRVIYDYYTDCEMIRCESYFKTISSTQWGKPIPIEFDKGKASVQNRRLWGDVAETEQSNCKNLHTNENQTSDCDADSTFSSETKKVRKRLILPVEQIPISTASSESLDVGVDLDYIWTQEDIKTRLRKSRQTKIGGGLVEDEGDKISRRKMAKRALISTISDDENDPDFTPENKQKRIRVNSEQPQKSERVKRRHLGVIKSTGKHSEKTEGQISEGSKAAESNEIGSDECEGEAQESRNGTRRWQDAGKCHMTTAPKYNANNRPMHSSTSPEDFYGARSAVVTTVKKHKFVDKTLINSSAVNHGDLDQCQINAAPEDSLSSSSVLGKISSFNNDTHEQNSFPVFHELVRPRLRQKERSSETRNISSTSNNSNSEQNEEIEEVLSGDSFEADDCNLDKSTKEKKHGGQFSALPKTYQKKKVKNVADQQLIISFAAPSFRIPKVMQTCPLCQKDFVMSNLEEHVQECVQLDDERKSNEMASDRS